MRLTVVIPCASGDTPEPALSSLERQTFRDFSVFVQSDPCRQGANWARNTGLRQVRFLSGAGELVLFSDADIRWEPDALQTLVDTLDAHPGASYAYGSYRMGGRDYAYLPFDPERLRRYNYISTMSVIRTAHFPGFDQSIRRFQDWDLWLTMLEAGKIGVYCGKTIFETDIRKGITFDGCDPRDAEAIVRRKHGLTVPSVATVAR